MALRAGTSLAIFFLLLSLSPTVMAQETVSHDPLVTHIIREPLSLDEFEQAYGDNTEIPRTDKEVLALARRLYHDPEQDFIDRRPVKKREMCGTYELQLLLTALKNPAISEEIRQRVRQMIDRVDVVPYKELIRGHFRFRYRDDHPKAKYNVTRDQVESAGRILNALWHRYTRDFRMPLSYGPVDREMIDVLVRPIANLGQTGPDSPVIELDPRALKDDCYRREVCAHELFHRVQFAYGWHWESRTAWLLEGSATWAQKWVLTKYYRHMYHMNVGLLNPNRDLFTRSYDACHLWVHLEERGTWQAIRDVWANYKKRRAYGSLDRVTRARLGLNFDDFLTEWMKTNYIKDTADAPLWYDYKEDEDPGVNCGRTDGPLAHVPKALIPVSRFTIKANAGGTLQSYGADYYVFPLDDTMTEFKLNIDGSDSGVFRYYVLGTKNNLAVTSVNGSGSHFTYQKQLAAGEWDQLTVIVMAMTFGGSYTLVFDGDTPVQFPDPVFESVIRKALGGWGPPHTGDILKSDLLRLVEIRDYGDSGQITNLSGLEYCSNITFLALGNHLFADLTPLARLNKLDQLYLENNQIWDLTPLLSMSVFPGQTQELKYLSLTTNKIKDLAPIQWITKLTNLSLDRNLIASVEPLGNLVNLEYLSLGYNDIVNLVPFPGLTKLKEIHLEENHIGSLQPLSTLPGLMLINASYNLITAATGLQSLSSVVSLNLSGNPLVDISDLAAMQDLQNVNLYQTNVDDIQPLVDNPGLGINTWLWLGHTKLSFNCDPAKGSTTDCDNVRTLRNRGVQVSWY